MIFVRMIRRFNRFPAGSKLKFVHMMRPKFNDALNTAAVKIDQYIMTINSCNTQDHFDHWGSLLQKGKNALWMEIDDLIECFDHDAVKLLLTPKNAGSRNHYRNFNHISDQTHNHALGHNHLNRHHKMRHSIYPRSQYDY